jgi:hypothetical protein
MKPILRASERDAIFRDAEFQSSDGQTHFEAVDEDAPTGGTHHQGWDMSTIVDPTQMHQMIESLSPTFHVLMDRIQDVGPDAVDRVHEVHEGLGSAKDLAEPLRHNNLGNQWAGAAKDFATQHVQQYGKPPTPQALTQHAQGWLSNHPDMVKSYTAAQIRAAAAQLEMNQTAPWFKPLGDTVPTRPKEPQDQWDFTGSPETQHHHRAFPAGGWDSISNRKDDIDDAYARARGGRRGITRAADRVAIFHDEDPKKNDSSPLVEHWKHEHPGLKVYTEPEEGLPDHDYLQHHLGDDEDWRIPRTAAVPAAFGTGWPQLNYEKPGGGSHGAEIHGDGKGGQWLVKKPPPNAPYMADIDVAAGQIAAHSGLEAPATFKTPTGGSAQKMYPGAKDAFPGSFDPESLSDPDLLTIQKHHALDWLMSNHDDHKQNFIRTPDGKLVGIDKGQSMKFINNDRLHWNFYPNEHEPVHNTLYRNFAQGGRQLNDPRQGELGGYIKGLQDIPDHEYRGMLEPYAKGAAAAGELGKDWSKSQYWNSGHTPMGPGRFKPNDVEGFLQSAVERKNSLMHDFGNLYDKAQAHRATGTKVAQHTAAGPDPDTLQSLHKTVGTHDSQLMVDPQGKWLIKKPNKGNEFAVPLDVATAQLQAHSGLDSPETYAVPMHDKRTNERYMASAVKWIPGSSQAFKKLPHLHEVSPQDKLELQKHHALDWLLANYDANVGNFMRNPQGKLVGIDKGQAFKYFGQDRLDHNFRPIYYGPEPIHNKLWREFAHGKPGEMLDPRQGELGDYVKNLQGMPDWKLRSMFSPFAHAAANAGMLATGSYSSGGFGPQDPLDPHRGLSEPTIAPNDPGKFLDALVARKNNLSQDLGDFYDKAAAERKISQLGPKLGPKEAPPPPKKHWFPPKHHYTSPSGYDAYHPYSQPKQKQPAGKPTLFDDDWGDD